MRPLMICYEEHQAPRSGLKLRENGLSRFMNRFSPPKNNNHRTIGKYYFSSQHASVCICVHNTSCILTEKEITLHATASLLISKQILAVYLHFINASPAHFCYAYSNPKIHVCNQCICSLTFQCYVFTSTLQWQSRITVKSHIW